MGINGDTNVNCISEIVDESGQLVLGTKDGRIYRYDRTKENFEFISDSELHDGSTIKGVDEICLLVTNG